MRIQAFQFKSLLPDFPEADHAARAAAALAAEELAPEPVIVPGFSAEDVAAAESNGYVKGMTDGQARAREEANTEAAQRDRKLAARMDDITAQIAAMAASRQQFIGEQARLTGTLALTIARKVAAEALKERPLAEIEAMVEECVPMLIGQPKITITLHPSLSANLRERVVPKLRAHGIEGECIIQDDAAMAMEDCRIDWKNGAAEKKMAELWKEISQVIDRMAKPEPMPAPAPEEQAAAPMEEAAAEPVADMDPVPTPSEQTAEVEPEINTTSQQAE